MNNVCKAFLRKVAVISASIFGLATPWSGPGPALGLDNGDGREITVTVCASIRGESGYDFNFSGLFDEQTPAMGTVKKKGHFCDGIYAQAWGVTRYRVVDVKNNDPYFEEIDSQASGLLAGGGNQSDSYTYISDLPPSGTSYQAWWTYEAAPSGDKPRGPSIEFRGDNKHTDMFIGLPGNFPPAEKHSGLGIYCQATQYKNPSGNGPRIISRAIGLAMDDKEFQKNILVKADWSKPVFLNHSARYVRNDKVEGQIGWASNYFSELGIIGDGTQTAELQVTWTISDKGLLPAEMDLIPQPGYDQWQPFGGQDEQTPGSRFGVGIDVHKFNQPGVPPDAKIKKLTVQLCNTSKEMGVCMNWPSQKKAKSDYDFRIKAAKPFTVDGDGQRAVAIEPPAQLGLGLDCFDFGAYTELTATAELTDGQVVVGHVKDHADKTQLVVPQDENHNHVADAWEKEVGVFSKNYPADWDGASVAGQRCDGDGITLYEKYRGFRSSLGYQRLQPERKYLFIFDPSDFACQSGGLGLFGIASSIAAVVLDSDDLWTGHGSSSGSKRIVNFNHGYGHKTDQHALDFVVDPSTKEQAPPGWAALMAKKHLPMAPLEDHVFGRTFPDRVADNKVSSPADAYQVTVYPKMISGDILLIGETCMEQTHHADPAKALEDFEKANPEQYPQSIAWQTRVTVAHEIGHGVGAPHHAGPTDGNRQCIMRYPDVHDKAWDASDPFWLHRYDPLPFIFCTGSPTLKSPGCMSNIQVTDHRGS